MDNRFAIIMVGLVAAFGAVLFFNKSDNGNTGNNQSVGQVSNHVKGEGKSSVVLTEYGDFECPACKAYYPLAKEVYEKYKAEITFEFKHFPIIKTHPNAVAAHRAAEAAGKQGKFFEMHDLLYEQQDSWNSRATLTPAPLFEAMAEQLKLDVAKFKTDVASAETNGTVNADSRKGNELKVTGTPTFFLNGKKIEQAPQDLDGFSKLIDAAIAAKKKS